MENKFLYSKLQLILEVLAKLYASPNYVKGSEIAELLNINQRGVRRLIEELRQLGYQIEAQPGIYGGYKLLKGNLFLPLIIEEKYQVAWQELLSYVISSKDLANYTTIIELLNALSILGENPPLKIYESYQGFQLNPIIKRRIDQAYYLLETAIKKQQVVRIVYERANSNLTNQFEFVPYQLLVYNQSYYIKGHYFKEHEVRTLKLSRIKEIVVTKKLFVFDEAFLNKTDDLPFSETAFAKIAISLKINQTRADLKDYIFGENQEIIEDETHFILNCEMYGNLVIESFVYSLGADCEVLAPLWLKEAVKKQAKLLYLKD